jgi:hypothetical protein
MTTKLHYSLETAFVVAALDVLGGIDFPWMGMGKELTMSSHALNFPSETKSREVIAICMILGRVECYVFLNGRIRIQVVLLQ